MLPLFARVNRRYFPSWWLDSWCWIWLERSPRDNRVNDPLRDSPWRPRRWPRPPHLQTVGVNKSDRIVAAVDVPVSAVLDRVAGEEAAGRAVVEAVTKELESGGVFLVAKSAGVAEGSGPGAGGTGDVAESNFFLTYFCWKITRHTPKHMGISVVRGHYRRQNHRVFCALYQ